MSKENIGIGFVGAGYIAHAHARALAAVPGARICAVCNPGEEKRLAFARTFGIARVYASIAEVLADPTVDAVVISTPNALHAEQTIAALAAGKHVFVEKPMACTVADAEAMVGAAQIRDRALMVGHMWRFDREARFIAESVETGAIGRIFRTTSYGIHADWGPDGWFTNRDLACGGAIADMGIHAIDTTRFLIGDPDPVRVYAHVGTHTGRVSEVDDTGIIFVEWKNGVVSTIEAGWWHPHMDGPEAATRLYGDGGYASLFPTFVRGGTPEERPDFPTRQEHCDQHMYTAQMQEFAAAIRDGRSPRPGGAEGLINTRIVAATYTAAKEHRVVEL